MESGLYIINCITNMHVGSGDISFGVIDNLVQRDCITGVPIINSSSLKGALREHFSIKNSSIVKVIFGGESNVDNPEKGSYKFYNANLLVYPVRSNVKQFFRATCPAVIKQLLQTAEDFELTIAEKESLQKLSELEVLNDQPIIFEKIKDVELEDFTANKYDFDNVKECEKLLGNDIALFNDDDFKNLICGENCLPVIARNNLENGISQNLWYEEIVPRESKFFFSISTSNQNTNFESALIKDKIQIGANATIGYGLTSIKKVEEKSE